MGLAKGFSEKDAALALKASNNNINAAVALLVNPETKRKLGKRAKESKCRYAEPYGANLEATAGTLAQLEMLGQEFELQVGLLRSRYEHALEELDFQQALHETVTPTERSSERSLPPESTFLPSVGTWLLPVPLKLQPEKSAGESTSGHTRRVNQIKETALRLEAQSKADLVALHERYSRALDTVCISHIDSQVSNNGPIVELLKAAEGRKSNMRARRCGA